LKYILYMQFII